jgi:hypothetical protein
MRSHSATQSRANHLPEMGFPNPSFTMQSMVDPILQVPAVLEECPHHVLELGIARVRTFYTIQEPPRAVQPVPIISIARNGFDFCHFSDMTLQQSAGCLDFRTPM